MKRSLLIGSAILPALLSLPLATDSQAAQITFESVAGNWKNPTDNTAGDGTGSPAITNGVPTSRISWGTVDNPGDPQSGYDFTRNNLPGPQTLPPSPTPLFQLGTFTHRNFPVNNPSLISVELDAVLLLKVDGVTTG